MEHNPYIDLNDGTAITYSDVKIDTNGKEYIVIYFETPTEDGFSSMRVCYPEGIPCNVKGYSEKEVQSLMEHYKKISSLAFEFAKEGV